MRRLDTIFLFMAVQTALWAVPATPFPIIHEQADGRFDTVYLHGDEYYHYYTDSHGQLIAGSEYREEGPDAEALRVSFHAPQKKMLYSFVPSSGTVRIPVILVNFTDLSFSIDDPIAQFDDLFNGSGGSNPHATGSVHTYYSASSNGALDLRYDVMGVYTLSHDMAYYGGNRSSGGDIVDHNIRASELVKEAVKLAYDAGTDFSPYDNNDDGFIDNISIVVAGYNEAEGGAANTIWPHYSVITNSSSYGGKSISGYLMISEYRSSGGKEQAGIGTYCHEFGHALGLPDLYNTRNSSTYTVGEWDIMCSGSYNNNGSTPPTYTAFERFMMGWLVPEQITSAGIRTLAPIETSNTAFLIAADEHNLEANSPSPSEYFLIENRQEAGWDAHKGALVAPGLLIEHITFNSSRYNNNTFNNQTPLGFSIVSAGFEQATSSSAADVFPGTTKRTTWDPTLNNGTILSDKRVTQIRQRSDMSIAMHFGSVEGKMMFFDPEELTMETSYRYSPESYDTVQTTLHVPAISESAIRMYLSSDRFRFSADNGMTWHTAADTVRIPITPGIASEIPVSTVFIPARQSCKYVYDFLTAETEDENLGTQITLSGRSPIAANLYPPVIDSATQVSTSSFNLYWEPEEDADWYDYTLYTIGEGTSEETEEFEDFDHIESIKRKGWETNLPGTQSSVSKSGNAMLFDRTGQYLRSPRYLYAPEAVSIWLSNTYTPNAQDNPIGGLLRMEATVDGQEWDPVLTLHIQRTTKNIYRSIELDTARHWVQFRLSYEHTGGNGGVVADNWTVHFAQNIQYIYRWGDYSVYSPGRSIVFRDLEPNTSYYYSMQAYNEQGCELRSSAACPPYKVTTQAEGADSKLVATRTSQGLYTIRLPKAADGQHTLGVFHANGTLVYQTTPLSGTTIIQLPSLETGKIYYVKYYNGKIHRKDPDTKILSY